MIKITEVTKNTEIDNIMDLVYVVYLGRYLKDFLEEEVDFSDLDSSPIYRMFYDLKYITLIPYALEQGWINDTFDFVRQFEVDKINRKFTKDGLDLEYYYLKDLREFNFELEAEYDIFSISKVGEIKAYTLQNAYLHMIGYFVVLKYVMEKLAKEQKELFTWVKPKINLEYQIFTARFNSVFVMHAIQYKEVAEAVEVVIPDTVKEKMHDYLYDNWIWDNQTKGNLYSKGYTYLEKYEHIKETKYYQPGLPVFFYEKSNPIYAGNITGLKQVQLAIIEEIKPMNIRLNLTSLSITKDDLTAIFLDNTQLEDIFVIDDAIKNLNQRKETFDLSTLGIDHYMMGTMRLWRKSEKEIKEKYLEEVFEEKFFIHGVGEPYTNKMKINTKDLPQAYQKGYQSFDVEFTYADAVLWLLKEWDVAFDEELYKEVYKDYFEFKGKPYAELNTVELYKQLQQSDLEINRQAGVLLEEKYLEVKEKEKSSEVE